MADPIIFTLQIGLDWPWKRPPRKHVFVVHGHDLAARRAVVDHLEQLGLTPIVLDEQPSGGKTIIEKFESHSRVNLAVVLLTPDDMGFAKGRPEDARPRARQNVIFELGYFVGKLGRTKVAALYSSGVAIPSDYTGVLYIPYDPSGSWRHILRRELAHAGAPIQSRPKIRGDMEAA